MKKLIYLVVAIVVVIILIFAFGSKKSSADIKDKANLTVYTSDGHQMGAGLFYVDFLKDIPEARLDVSIDFNQDGNFADDEKVAKNIPFHSRKDWKSGVAIALPQIINIDNLKARVLVGGKSYDLDVVVSKEEMGNLLDLGTVTNPEESMKGWSNIAHAQNKEPVTDAYRPGVSDITQKPAECGPTSATNSLISLAEEHGKAEGLPSPTDIINELKLDMDWTPADGVLPNAFVQGKNEWAMKHGLPIKTTKVGDVNGLKTLQKLLESLDSGSAAELRITFGDAELKKAVGGHMVTVTGVRIDGGQTFITIADPNTKEEGEETYEVQGNTIMGYPFDGVAVLSWGFVQTWDEGAPSNLEPMTPAEIQGIKESVGIKEKIKVIVVKGEYVPIAQVHVGKGEECDQEPHYHANNTFVTSLNGVKIFDPGGCGFGKVKSIPVDEVDAP